MHSSSNECCYAQKQTLSISVHTMHLDTATIWSTPAKQNDDDALAEPFQGSGLCALPTQDGSVLTRLANTRQPWAKTQSRWDCRTNTQDDLTIITQNGAEQALSPYVQKLRCTRFCAQGWFRRDNRVTFLLIL